MLLFCTANPLRYFFAVNCYIPGRIDSQFHLIALNGRDCDCDVVADEDGFADPARENQHVDFLSLR